MPYLPIYYYTDNYEYLALLTIEHLFLIWKGMLGVCWNFVTCFALGLKGEDCGEKEIAAKKTSRHIKSLGPNKQRE